MFTPMRFCSISCNALHKLSVQQLSGIHVSLAVPRPFTPYSTDPPLVQVDWVARKLVGLKSNVVTDLARQSQAQQGVALAK